MLEPTVWIIVLNYNGKAYTLDCLESLYRTDYPAYKVVVVDNGSKDGSADAVRAAYPQAEVVETGANLYYAGGNNVGIRLALDSGADYVLLLNNDTVVGEGLVRELVAAMRECPDAGLAGPMIYYYPPKPGGRELIWYAGGIVDFGRGLTAHRGLREEDKGQYSGVEDTGYITGCGMLATRECLENTGLLDTSFVMYAEDADLSIRAEKAGYRLLFVPKAVMWHKVSSTMGGEFSPSKIKRKIKSNLLLFARHARPYHWLTIPFYVLARAAKFFFSRVR